jgi:asparagine synthase (glutamine-hydrolysing)
MTDQLIHRGPDDAGTWVDSDAGVALGSRRLAIVDLSPAGHQPMLSFSERYVIVFNGEVYNFCELRQELEPKGHKFRGHSDTEVILAAVSEWGLETAVQKFVGMFAFVLWDRQRRVLHLVRDRLGIKPLYYGWAGRTFLFGSELKAFRAHPDFTPEIDRNALALGMRFNYIPQPYSIYKGICKLPSGYILSVKGEGAPHEDQLATYWSGKEVAERAAADPFKGSEAEATEQLETLLRAAVRLRMVADVPLGAFLSGGIDSSTVVALMQAQSNRPVKTFTIGFQEKEYDEALYAKQVAAHLGTEHTELYLTPEETLAVIPKLPILFDEPFSDSSQIPTYLISALARRQVTVSLSGDGGDELFAGYPRYFRASSAWAALRWLPAAARRALATLIISQGPASYSRWLAWLSPLLGRYGRAGTAGEKIHKLAEVLTTEGAEALYLHFVSHWKHPSDVVLGAAEIPTVFTDSQQWPEIANYWDRMMFFDLATYLPDDILTKVDLASMGVSLEARVPLLDHRVVEFAVKIPISMKVRNGRGKWLLRQVLERYVPRRLINRPKMGFSVPIDEWLRGPLKSWAEELFNPDRLRREGYFRPEPIRKLWAEHLSGQRNWGDNLWDVLMFQAWRETWA